MKIFQAAKEQLVLLGITPNASFRFGWKISMCFLVFGLSILSNVMAIFSKDNIILIDDVENICAITAFIEVGICLLTIVLQQRKLFVAVESFQKLINESKSISVRWWIRKTHLIWNKVKKNWNFRNEIRPIIKSSAWRRTSNCWEILWHFVRCLCKSIGTIRNLATTNDQFDQIFGHRFEWRCIWIANAVVVSVVFSHNFIDFHWNVKVEVVFQAFSLSISHSS